MGKPPRHALWIGILGSLVAATALAQSADRPVLHAGDSWTYRQTSDSGKEAKETTWVRKVVGVGADGAEMQIGERTFKVDSSLNIVDAKGANWSRQQYRFPMQVGTEWSFVNKVQIQVNEVDQRNSYKVVAYEPLTVPAGTFDCYRVEGKLDLTFKQSFSRQTKETYWYCPKVASFAKMVRDTQVTARDSPSSREKTEIVLMKYQGKG